MIEYTPSVNDTYDQRRWWRNHFLFRKLYLLDLLGLEDNLQEDFLSSNEYQKSLVVKNWVERDEQELIEIDLILKKLEEIDGPITKEQIHEVQEKFKKVFEEDD